MPKWTFEQDSENSLTIKDEQGNEMCQILAAGDRDQLNDEEVARAQYICDCVAGKKKK